jgi:hypothetical protein
MGQTIENQVLAIPRDNTKWITIYCPFVKSNSPPSERIISFPVSGDYRIDVFDAIIIFGSISYVTPFSLSWSYFKANTNRWGVGAINAEILTSRNLPFSDKDFSDLITSLPSDRIVEDTGYQNFNVTPFITLLP